MIRGSATSLRFAAFAALGAALAAAQDNVMAPPAANVMAPRAGAAGTPAAPHFVRLDAFDFRALLPAPPAAGSLEARADLETAALAITPQKQRRIQRAVHHWLARHPRSTGCALRADAILIAPGQLPRRIAGVFDLSIG